MKKTMKHVLWAVFIIIALTILISQETMKARLRERIAEQNVIHAEITAYNEKLKNTLDLAPTDEYVYQQARTRLMMVRENETIVVDSSKEANTLFKFDIEETDDEDIEGVEAP